MTLPPPSQAADEDSGSFFTTIAHRPRLIAGIVVMAATYLLTAAAPVTLRESTRLLIAWNAGTWVYLGLIAMMMHQRGAHPRIQARPEDENQWVLLLFGVTAACASLAAIVWELGPVKNMEGLNKAGHVALVVTSVLSAWAYIQIMFAIHYAGVYFAAVADGEPGGLDFPGAGAPGWTEFVYQAFTIGCTFASSDTSVTTARMRRICVIHSVVAFLFNTIVLALAINIAAGFF